VFFATPSITCLNAIGSKKHLAGICAAAALLVSAPLFAQDAPPADNAKPATNNACGKGNCQHNVHVTLKQANGAAFDRVFPEAPAVVQPFGFGVFVGQTVYIEADVADGKLVNLVSVDKMSNPEKTVTAKFEQVEGKGMMLTVTNPFQKMLKFDMAVLPLGQRTLTRTSSCPVGAGIMSVELWQEPILHVALIGGHFLPDSDKVTCQ